MEEITMKIKSRINCDKLYISYQPDKKLATLLGELEIGVIKHFNDFQLRVIEKNERICAELLCGEYYLGIFTFNDNAIVFEYDNKALYSAIGGDCKGQKYNLQSVFEAISEELGLIPSGIRKLELAADVNKCPQLRALISDWKNYDMIYNGKKIEDDEAIPYYKEVFGRTRKALERNPTVYFGQARKDGIKFKLYDKQREINKVSNKDYITEFNEFNAGGIYRLEVTIVNKQWKEWLDKLKTGHGNYSIWPNETESEYIGRNIYYLATDYDYQCALFDWLASRVLYFRVKKTKEEITLLDLCGGWIKPHH